MHHFFLEIYRSLPAFKGKLRLGQLLFKGVANKKEPVEFKAHAGIVYKIPNTLESLGVVLLLTGIYEKKVIRFLRNHVKENDTYFDIGANIGSLGLPVIKNKPGVRYVGFEASPAVFEYLQYNFSANKVVNYALHNYVVHAGDDQPMKFYQSDEYGKSSLAPTYTHEFITVNSVSIDSFCNEHTIRHIHWMKIDVQGFEFYVFQGMKQLLLNRKVDNILFEFEYWAEADSGLEKGAAQKYISALGYDLFDLEGKRLKNILTNGRAMIWAKPKNN